MSDSEFFVRDLKNIHFINGSPPRALDLELLCYHDNPISHLFHKCTFETFSYSFICATVLHPGPSNLLSRSACALFISQICSDNKSMQWNIPIYSFFYVHITSFQTSILSCSFKYIISAWEKKNVNKSFREQGIVTEVTSIGTLTPVRCIPYPLPYNIILMLSFVCGSFSL